MAIKNWVKDAGTVLSYVGLVGGVNGYTDMTGTHANMVDEDWDTYSEKSGSGGGPAYYYTVLVATLASAQKITSIGYKGTTSADGSFGLHEIWIYNGSWVQVYTASGNTGSTTVGGPWAGVTKIQWSTRGYANDPVAWTMNVKFYEAVAIGGTMGYAGVL